VDDGFNERKLSGKKADRPKGKAKFEKKVRDKRGIGQPRWRGRVPVLRVDKRKIWE